MSPTRTPIATARPAPTRSRPAPTRKPAQRNLSVTTPSTRKPPTQGTLARSSVQPAQPTVAPPAEAPVATFVPFDMKSCQREIKDTEASLKSLMAIRPHLQRQADAARGFPEHHSHTQLQQLDRQCAELSQKLDAVKARMAVATADNGGGSLATRMQDLKQKQAELAKKNDDLLNSRTKLFERLDDLGGEKSTEAKTERRMVRVEIRGIRQSLAEVRSQHKELRKEALSLKALQQELMATAS